MHSFDLLVQFPCFRSRAGCSKEPQIIGGFFIIIIIIFNFNLALPVAEKQRANVLFYGSNSSRVFTGGDRDKLGWIDPV